MNFLSLPASTNQPLTAFPTDLYNLPDVSFVIPNLTNDMPDGSIAQGDAWLESNRIPTIMAGQRVTPGTYTETIDHDDVLRTLQDGFGLPPLANSAAADPILDVWNPGAGSQAPVARSSSSCSELVCSFDGTASSDAEGPVSYSWAFGDGSTGSGSSPGHTYAGSGPYDMKLTMTDNQGATDVVTHQVVVSSTTAPFAVSSFARTVSNGWGSADVGGAWSLSGTASAFSVAGGFDVVRHAAVGSQVTATLAAVSSADTDLTFGFNVDKLSAGNYLTVAGRRVSAGNEYRARVLINAANEVNVMLVKAVGGTATTVAADNAVPGVIYAPRGWRCGCGCR